MARTPDRKRRAATSSGAALAAVMLGSPGLAAPAPAEQAGQVPTAANSGRSGPHIKYPSEARALNFSKIKMEYKHKGEYSVAGVGDGHIVFEDERGKLFYLDEATGDQKFVSGKVFSKVELDRVGKPDLWIKRMSGKITLLGIDQGGKVIMSNPRGEKFYLDPATGDMIFVK